MGKVYHLQRIVAISKTKSPQKPLKASDVPSWYQMTRINIQPLQPIIAAEAGLSPQQTRYLGKYGLQTMCVKNPKPGLRP